MANGTEQRNEAREAYESVLGYLSEDAQAAVFRYLPYLEACVDKEVAAFGKDLATDLNKIICRESNAVCERMDDVKKKAKRVVKFIKKNGLDKLEEKVDGVVYIANNLNRMAREGASLLSRAQVFATHVAEWKDRHAPEGLQHAASALRESYERWFAEIPGNDEKTDSRAAETLGKIESLVENLVPAHPECEDASDKGGGDGAQEAVCSAEEGSESEMSREELEKQEKLEKEAEEILAELTVLIWKFVKIVQQAQAKWTEELATATAGLNLGAATSPSGWCKAADNLQSSADETKQIAKKAAENFKNALESGIAAAKLDIFGSTGKGSKRRRWWHFRRRS